MNLATCLCSRIGTTGKNIYRGRGFGIDAFSNTMKEQQL